MSFRSSLFAAAVFILFGHALSAEDRTINGTGNNVLQPTWGAANQPMIRFKYRGEFGGPNGAMLTDAQRTNARDISNAISAQSVSRPSARGLSNYIWAWGQFLTHDTDLVTTSNGASVNGTAPIAVNSPTDPLGPNPIPFVRGNFSQVELRIPINEVTSYIDASQIYGSNPARAAALRSGGGSGAKLLTSANNLLPYNTAGLPNENNGPVPGDQLFLAGDIRANENSLLTRSKSSSTRFLRTRDCTRRPLRRSGAGNFGGFHTLFYYRALDDRTEILAILHGSRDPRVWQRRT
jgi:hypothetical protein